VVIISAADQQPPYKINGYLITQRLIYVMVRQTNRTNEEGSNDNIRLLSDSSPPHDLSLMDQQHWNEFWTHPSSSSDAIQDMNLATRTGSAVIQNAPAEAYGVGHNAPASAYGVGLSSSHRTSLPTGQNSLPGHQAMMTSSFPLLNQLMGSTAIQAGQYNCTLPSFDTNRLLGATREVPHATTTMPPIQTMLMPYESLKTTETSTEPRQLINIDAFQADREVTQGEAIMYCIKTRKLINVNDTDQVKKAVQELSQLKKSVKDTAHSYLVKDILLNAKGLALPDGTPLPTRRLDDLCDIWRDNQVMAEQLWTILVKRYEDMGDWELTFEDEIMDAMNLEYVEDESMRASLEAKSKDKDGNVTKVTKRQKSRKRGNKGCVSRVVTLAKRDIIKQFNNATKKTHKTKITSVNADVQHNEDGTKKYKKKHIKSTAFSTELHTKQAKVCYLIAQLHGNYYLNSHWLLLLHSYSLNWTVTTSER
jgi:hypothetical protein